jgi:hypothetical protein
MSYEQVSEEEFGNIILEAREWFKSTDGRFADCKSVAISVVAEYIANERNKTLWKVD